MPFDVLQYVELHGTSSPVAVASGAVVYGSENLLRCDQRTARARSPDVAPASTSSILPNTLPSSLLAFGNGVGVYSGNLGCDTLPAACSAALSQLQGSNDSSSHWSAFLGDPSGFARNNGCVPTSDSVIDGPAVDMYSYVQSVQDTGQGSATITLGISDSSSGGSGGSPPATSPRTPRATLGGSAPRGLAAPGAAARRAGRSSSSRSRRP